MTKHGRRILLKTRGFLGRLVAAFAGAVMLLTNVPAVNADNADKRDRITESAEKVSGSVTKWAFLRTRAFFRGIFCKTQA